jgi:methylenetetrahydrofolate reductase (NADPH)
MATTVIDKHFMELVAPKQNAGDLDGDCAKFADRYRLFLEHDKVICITDNPMGNLSFMGPEIVPYLDLPVHPGNIMVHLNTFHRKTEAQYDPSREQNEQDLDIILQHARALGIACLLCVSGDGCQKFSRLKPEDLGLDPAAVKTVTSVELLRYIRTAYPGIFKCGAAFNQYEPAREELEKLERKLAAGAAFIVTQPAVVNTTSDPRIVTANDNLARMLALADERGAQVILEAWMSSKYTPLMSECVGYDINFSGFDPWANLRDLRRLHPERKLYLSMIFGPKSLRQAEEMIAEV